MKYEDILDKIEQGVEAIQRNMNEDYGYEVTTHPTVMVNIDGEGREYVLERQEEITLTINEFVDDTIKNALAQIREALNQMDQLRDSGELLADLVREKVMGLAQIVPSIAATTVVPAEAPTPATATVGDNRPAWPGLSGTSPSAADYPNLYKPPPGYDWTGEYRVPVTSEWYVSSGAGRPNRGGVEMSKNGGVRPLLRQLAAGEEPSYQLASATPVRKPWPGSEVAKNVGTTREEFADEYDPPTGYVYTGEFRPVDLGDLFLSSTGRVEHAETTISTGRHILGALSTTEIPERGDWHTIPAAPSSPTTAAPEFPATPEFEPPKPTTPV